ncbi:MAG: hypothetical protein PHO63_05395 [Bacilli bacterium]|nr:hypothetical protein [Bacilli bacterium]
MNKIYNAFSSIKASDELKEKTYQKIIENSNIKTKKTKTFYLSLVLTSIIICIFLYNYSDSFNSFTPNNDHIITTKDETDIIMYNNNKYVLDNNIIIDKDMLDKKLDIIITQDNMMESYNSNSSNISIYSIKNIDESKQIAVLRNNKILVYKIDI